MSNCHYEALKNMFKKYIKKDSVGDFRLKPLSQVIEENEDLHKVEDNWISYKNTWTINPEMAIKFGNGYYYRFERNTDFPGYDYQCVDDGFYYDSSWFMMDEEEPVLELDEEDFFV